MSGISGHCSFVSGNRIGKGEGFADLEWAMMTSMGAVTKDTIVVTTVHDCQVIDFPETLAEEHDLTVNYIVTPTEIIRCNNPRAKPSGIFWSKLQPVKLRRVPILRKLMEKEREAGKDVTLKDGADPDEIEDKENLNEGDGDFRRRRNYGGRYRGGYRGRGYGRRPRREHTESEGDGAGDNANEEGEDGEKDGGRRRYRRFRRRRAPRRRSDEGEGDGEHKDDDGKQEDGEDGENKRRAQRRFRPRRGRQPALFVGGLPRSLRVSEFKAKVRGNDVEPLRVIWKGGNGHAFLQFENSEEMESALDALAELDINGKKLRVEQAYARRPQRSRSEDGPNEPTENGEVMEKEKEVA